MLELAFFFCVPQHQKYHQLYLYVADTQTPLQKPVQDNFSLRLMSGYWGPINIMCYSFSLILLLEFSLDHRKCPNNKLCEVVIFGFQPLPGSKFYYVPFWDSIGKKENLLGHLPTFISSSPATAPNIVDVNLVVTIFS